MSAGTWAANLAWAAGNLAAARRFDAALREPAEAQEAWLRASLRRDATSAFGREHGLGGRVGYAQFARRVPLRAWEDFAPWVERVRLGEANVLGAERVTHLAPTSGSSGARKLIPFTAGLQAGFSAAVGAWMSDLVRRRPGLLGGPAYWSVSPVAAGDEDESSAVRVGYADDAEYLGGLRARLVRKVLAVPADVRHERDLRMFWRRTLIGMLGRRDLRLISVWHPSFFDLLLEEARGRWEELCAGIVDTRRAAELRSLGPAAPGRWWPGLRVISCWGDQAAEPGCRALRDRFPGVWVQAKGLLATEAVVTIPWRGEYPVAVRSHFFEFVDEAGGVRRLHELERGRSYEVVVTNGGGLWRYRLGDLVECTGRVAATPTLRFLGRAGNVSDLRGEKLSEAFVAEVLSGLWPAGARPEAAVLRAREADASEAAGYELVCTARADDGDLAGRLEAALGANPHYAGARRLGQLARARVVAAGEGEVARLRRLRGRMGDAKPLTLLKRGGDCARGPRLS